MNYYRLSEGDQSKPSWVMFLTGKRFESRQASSLPPAMFKLFGPQPEGEMFLKTRYLSACCNVCGRYEEDEIFSAGFEDPVSIKLRGDFSHTNDRIFVVSEKFLKALKQAKVQGYETIPVGTSGWHALRVTHRVECAKKVMQLVKPVCKGCGRAKGCKGLIRYQKQLSVPPVANTLFTTVQSWPHMLSDRDIFLTEDVVQALKKAGIKGGLCDRLFNDAEAEEAEAKLKEGLKYMWWAPKNSQIRL